MLGEIEQGKAASTEAYNLMAARVIHTAMPRHGCDNRAKEKVLRTATEIPLSWQEASLVKAQQCPFLCWIAKLFLKKAIEVDEIKIDKDGEEIILRVPFLKKESAIIWIQEAFVIINEKGSRAMYAAALEEWSGDT